MCMCIYTCVYKYLYIKNKTIALSKYFVVFTVVLIAASSHSSSNIS